MKGRGKKGEKGKRESKQFISSSIFVTNNGLDTVADNKEIEELRKYTLN